MSYLFEVYYKGPQDVTREERLTKGVVAYGGRFDFWEKSEISNVCNYVCLTFEFDDYSQAERAVGILGQQGEHVEGPGLYGD